MRRYSAIPFRPLLRRSADKWTLASADKLLAKDVVRSQFRYDHDTG